MTAAQTQSEVVIVGGGFAGLTAGLVLSEAGLRVTVLEAHEGPHGAFRGELLHPPGVHALKALGLNRALMSAGGEYVSGFSAFSSLHERPVILPYGVTGPGLGLDHGEMLGVFRSELLSRPHAKLLRARATGLLRKNGRVVGVRCDDGSEQRALLVVGADGRHSRTRGLLGLPAKSNLLSYTLAPALVGDVLPTPGHGNVLLGAPGPILAYPYGKGRVRMIIDVPTGVGGGRAGLVAFVRAHYSAALPKPLRDAMMEALETGHYGASANHAVTTETCAAPGAALVGDAAGCSHPLTATGMTTSLNDVNTLLRCLSKHGFGDQALLAYEKRRYRFSRARDVFAHALYEIFRGAGEGPRALRDGIFRYWRRSERARRASMSILSGDDSSLTTFATEYVRVIGTSGWGTMSNNLRDGRGTEAARTLAAMMGTATDCFNIAADRALETLVLQRAKALNAPDPLWRRSLDLAASAARRAGLGHRRASQG